jgi:hypothetical protein
MREKPFPGIVREQAETHAKEYFSDQIQLLRDLANPLAFEPAHGAQNAMAV